MEYFRETDRGTTVNGDVALDVSDYVALTACGLQIHKLDLVLQLVIINTNLTVPNDPNLLRICSMPW